MKKIEIITTDVEMEAEKNKDIKNEEETLK
ncbi:MAG: hypothetical protein DDT22_01011 [candidate division WS2 bacterium]|nr:hypothetical protein [Candidatus Lithacetigena glycinireducens]